MTHKVIHNKENEKKVVELRNGKHYWNGNNKYLKTLFMQYDHSKITNYSKVRKDKLKKVKGETILISNY